jgi:hypothetical protein
MKQHHLATMVVNWSVNEEGGLLASTNLDPCFKMSDQLGITIFLKKNHLVLKIVANWLKWYE